MPSPFPGLDPYLESPDIWPDFHDVLAGEIRAVLNSTLPAPYYARLEMRPEVGIVDEDQWSRRIVPDVAVARRPRPGAAAGASVLEMPRTRISESVELEITSEAIQHLFVEIRDPSRGHTLVTLIEIASPSNKRSGPDRRAYLRKQGEVLQSEASLIELDLLRTGARLLVAPELECFVAELEPRPDYLVLVNRAWRRGEGVTAYQIFPTLVTDPLPCIPVPLRQGQEEVPLDLQFAFVRAYDSGPYRRGAVDYSRAPEVALREDLTAWAERCLAAWPP